MAALSDSAYERLQHSEEIRKAGWTDAEIAAIEIGDRSGVPDDFAATMDFVDACVAAPSVSDETFAAALHVLGKHDIARVLLVIGRYMMIARFTGILHVDLDAKPDRWTSEH